MGFEKLHQIEKVSDGRKRLLSLEKSGRYVFHGSPDIIDVLEPRQAFNHSGETGEMGEDGKPAVFATTYADVAIFRALTGIKDVAGKSASNFGMHEDGLHFSATYTISKKPYPATLSDFDCDFTKITQNIHIFFVIFILSRRKFESVSKQSFLEMV